MVLVDVIYLDINQCITRTHNSKQVPTTHVYWVMPLSIATHVTYIDHTRQYTIWHNKYHGETYASTDKKPINNDMQNRKSIHSFYTEWCGRI